MRQVYYDPFGSRLEGYQAGVRDETGLQDNTRRARLSDWDYTNMAPLRLQQAQREQRMADFAEPYLQRQYGLNERQQAANLYGTEQPLYEHIGQVTGNYAPALTNAGNFGMGTQRYVDSSQYFAPQVALYDQQVRGGVDPAQDEYEGLVGDYARMYGVHPQVVLNAMRSGLFQPNATMEQGYDQYLNYDRARQNAADANALQQQGWARQVQEAQIQNQADQLAASRAWYGLQRGYATGQYGTGAGGYQGYTGAEDGF